LELAYYATTSTTVVGNPNATISNGALTLGQSTSVIGKLLLAGNSSGVVTIAPQAAAGTFNFNLPVTAGAAGVPLLSAGGGASPMTWGTISGNTGEFGTVSGSLTSGNCIKADANGNLVDALTTCGGSGSPGGSNTQVQFNNSSSFGGSADFLWVDPALTIGFNGISTGQMVLANGNTSGASVTVQNNAATIAYNFNLPVTAGTSGQPLLSGGGGSTALGGAGAHVPYHLLWLHERTAETPADDGRFHELKTLRDLPAVICSWAAKRRQIR
jgi:hypothetical protein